MKYLGLLLAITIAVTGAHAVDTIDLLAVEKDATETVLTSLAQIEELARSTQKQFWQLVPPSGNNLLYIHPDSTVRTVNWKSKGWPKSFLKQMIAEMGTVGRSGSLYPFYKLTVVETREGELLWYNGGRLVWQTAAPLGYSEHLFAFQHWNVDSIEALSTQKLLWGRSSNVGLEILILPKVFMKSYEQDVALEAELMAFSEPLAMMSMQTVTNLVMAIISTNGMAELEIGWPVSFENRIDIFGCMDLIAGNWGVLAKKLPTREVSSLVWLDTISSNFIFRAYRAGDSDLDSDGDFLPDSHELVIHHSLTNSADSDGGTIPDGYEAAFGMDPNDSSDETTAAIAAYQLVAGDPDGDLSPGWVEARDGTNPHDRFDSTN